MRNHDVGMLVVSASPTGLMTANELSRHGVRCLRPTTAPVLTLERLA